MKKINYRSKPLHLRGRKEFFCSSDPVWCKLFSLLIFSPAFMIWWYKLVSREKKNESVSHMKLFFFFFKCFHRWKKKRNFECFSGFSRHLPTRSRVISIGEKITLICLRNWITRKKKSVWLLSVCVTKTVTKEAVILINNVFDMLIDFHEVDYSLLSWHDKMNLYIQTCAYVL